ncbi:MAG: trehalose-6-phosphate synthase [Acidimicrobiales bacterium]|nr:trehalose-6-phosphate synthase [Acidimicrobiales bacterium]
MTAALVVLSNRGPVSFSFDDAGEPRAGRAGGGLASTLGGGVRDSDSIWVAAAMNDAERSVANTGELEADGYRLHLVDIPQHTFDLAYNEVANRTLWFWHHHLFDVLRQPVLDGTFRRAWDAFRSVNQLMADAAAHAAAPNATVLVHDYHLALAPAMLRAARPDVRISHFTHTPFVNPAFLSMLPDDVVHEILVGMAGADAVGFHAPRWAESFVGCWRTHASTRQLPIPRTYVAPAAADHDAVAEVSASDACAEQLAKLDDEIGDCARIVRVDRIEPSKNLLRGFWAYRILLEEAPELRGKVCLVALCYPSRESLEEYKRLHEEVEHEARIINERFATDSWTPVILETNDHFPRSIAALRSADVLLINPIRDGLNLVAYEAAVINEHDAVLCLSREAGSFDELGPAGVLAVNPIDISGTADVLFHALTMDATERTERAAKLRVAAGARTPAEWLQQQLDAANEGR